MTRFIVIDCYQSENEGIVEEFTDINEALAFIKNADEVEGDGYYLECIE